MRARSAVGLAVAALAVTVSAWGCGDSNAKVLSEATYCKNVPVYKGAKFKDQMGNESWGDTPGSHTNGMTWWFETKATRAELLAYYEKLYPNAEKMDLDDGAVQLSWVPEGATGYEDVSIVVEDGSFRIGESVNQESVERQKRGEPVPASMTQSAVRQATRDYNSQFGGDDD